MKRARALPAGLSFLGLVSGVVSCTSILGTFDYDKGTGGSATSGSTAASSSGAASCTEASACPSGFCVDGVCCDTACTDTCHACTAALTGSADGTCAIVTAGTPAPKGQCAADPPCGNDGKCAAGGVCEQPAAGVACGATCASGTLTNNQCDGNGTCAAGSSVPCTGSLDCNGAGTACLTTCSGDSDCTAGHYCSNGACVLEAGLGMPCTGNDQCPSGFCADGVCCNTACDGMCSSCNLAGSVGICKSEPDNQNNPDHACTTGSTCCSGACTSLVQTTSCGTCGNTCTTSTLCQTPTCSATGTCGSTAVKPGTACNDSGGTVCNAAGACVECNTVSDCGSGTTASSSGASSSGGTGGATGSSSSGGGSGGSGGSGPGAPTVACCNNKCVDLSSSATNCNACGHDCLGGACMTAVCQPSVLATFGFAGDTSQGEAIVLDSTNVYWSWTGSQGGGGVMQVPLAGGPVVALVQGSAYNPSGIALAADSVFFANQPASIEECQIGGCGGMPMVLDSSQQNPTAMGVDPHYLYWASDTGVNYLNFKGGGSATLEPGGASALAVDPSSNVYWIEGDNPMASVLSTPNLGGVLGGGSVTTLVPAFDSGGAIAFDSNYVYFVSINPKAMFANHTVLQVPIAGGNASAVSPGLAGIFGLAVDASNVYYFGNGRTLGAPHYYLTACPLPSCATGAATFYPTDGSVGPLAVNSTAIYWVESNKVMKVAK